MGGPNTMGSAPTFTLPSLSQVPLMSSWGVSTISDQLTEDEKLRFG